MQQQPTIKDLILALNAIRRLAEDALETAGIDAYDQAPLGDTLINIIGLVQDFTKPFETPAQKED